MNSNSFSILNRRQIGLFVAAGALLLALVLPTIAGAAQLTARSVELTSSSKLAEDVTYKVNFTAASTAGAVVVNFCKESPLIGATCTTPDGFDTTLSTVGSVESTAANTVVVTQAVTVGANSVTITKVQNPDAAGTIYARIITYNDATNAALYDSAQASSLDTNRIDDGGAAISITDSIGVSAAVLETLSFCVSSNTIAASCADAALTGLKLGEPVSLGVTALDATKLSTGNIYTQISTNAVSGAVVNLKSGAANCGGLIRVGGAANCDIKPVLFADSATFAPGQAKFGVKTTASINSATGTASGTYKPVTGSNYGVDNFLMNYDDTGLTGVTSPYGDPFLDTAGAPVNNKNIMLTFGASISNDTPAGLYKADIGLIATGKF